MRSKTVLASLALIGLLQVAVAHEPPPPPEPVPGGGGAPAPHADDTELKKFFVATWHQQTKWQDVVTDSYVTYAADGQFTAILYMTKGADKASRYTSGTYYLEVGGANVLNLVLTYEDRQVAVLLQKIDEDTLYNTLEKVYVYRVKEQLQGQP